jgi:hypothetical protein
MKFNIILLLYFNLCFSYDYYSLKLNKIYLSELTTPNETLDSNITINNLTQEQLDELEEYIDLPLNSSELKELNESYIKTKNIKSELYTIDSYIGSSQQYFRLLLSTFDDYNTIFSINCESCNVSNKYNFSLSNNNINISNNNNEEIIIDSCVLPMQSKENGLIKKNNITIDNFLIKVIEKNETENKDVLNSEEIDGIISLSFNMSTQIPNNNFIMELYNEGKISSPSFSIIITSLNNNRLYLGDIMKNDYIKNYINSSMNKGDCPVIGNYWQCQIEKLEYTDFKSHLSSFTKWENSMVKFNLNEKKLVIPDIYYDKIIIGYYTESKKGRRRRVYNKYCYIFSGQIYCSCSADKKGFGVMTLIFQNNSRLDIDIRDYVYYDESAYFFKCRVDATLSNYDEFVIGLKGLNNTILSFDLDDRKIEFFHKKKAGPNLKLWIIIIGFILGIALGIISILEERYNR